MSTSVDFAKLAISVFADCRVYVESIADFVDYLVWLSIFSTALTSVDVAKFVMKISTDGVLPQNIPKLYGSWDKKTSAHPRNLLGLCRLTICEGFVYS